MPPQQLLCNPQHSCEVQVARLFPYKLKPAGCVLMFIWHLEVYPHIGDALDVVVIEPSIFQTRDIFISWPACANLLNQLNWEKGCRVRHDAICLIGSSYTFRENIDAVFPLAKQSRSWWWWWSWRWWWWWWWWWRWWRWWSNCALWMFVLKAMGRSLRYKIDMTITGFGYHFDIMIDFDWHNFVNFDQ